MNPYSIPPFMSALLVILLGLYVLLMKNAGEAKKPFFAFSCIVFIWQTSFGIMYSMKDPVHALFWARCAYLGLSFGGVSNLHFHLKLLNKKIKYLKALYAISALFAVLSWTPWFFKGVKLFFWGYYPQGSLVIYPVFVCFFLLTLWAGPLFCLKEAFTKQIDSTLSDIQRRQLRLNVMGFITCNFAIVDYFAKFGIPIYPFGYLNVVIWVVTLAFTITQYHLMDEEQVASMIQSAKLTALGTMAASLNHELRNPLYIAKGKLETYVDSVERGISLRDEKSFPVINTVLQQLNRAMDIMQRFTDFARPQNQVKKEKVVVKEAFNNVLHFVSSEFEMNRIRVNMVPTNGLSIYANSRQLEEILFNLAINACHAMEKDGGELTFNAYQPNGKVIVEVADNGPGIPKDLQRKIFQPFYSTKGNKGSGLGLYITKQLVERNGGKISVKSKPGEGTSFRLEFKR